MTVNLYKGLNQRSGSAIGSLADYMQTNRQMKEQSRQFDAAHDVDKRKMALLEEQATNNRRDVMWDRQKAKMQADLANFNTLEVEKGRAAALQHGLQNGMFENAMWDELANRPEVDASVPPELVQLDNGNFGVKVTRKDGGVGFITQDGSSNPNSQVVEFSYDDLYNGYMDKAAEYGFTDVGRAIGKAYQTENNNDVVAEISLEGAGQPQGTGAMATGGTGGGGSTGSQSTGQEQQPEITPAVGPGQQPRPRDAAPEPVVSNSQPEPSMVYNKQDPGQRPVKPTELEGEWTAPEVDNESYVPFETLKSQLMAAGSMTQGQRNMLSRGIEEGYYSKAEAAELARLYKDLNAEPSPEEEEPGLWDKVKEGAGNAWDSITGKVDDSTDALKAWVKEQESKGTTPEGQAYLDEIKEKGYLGYQFDQTKAGYENLKSKAGNAFTDVKRTLFGERSVRDSGGSGSTATQDVPFTALDIPMGPGARDVVNQQGKVAIGQTSSGQPLTVDSRAITDQKFTLRITGDKSRYTNEQKAMMLASALAVGADDPSAVARTVRETMTSIMNKDGTSDAKVNLLRDLVNNQARVEAAKISAKSKLDGKAYEAWQEQYDQNRKRFEETMMSHAKLHFANDDNFDTESLSAMAYTSARNNIGRLVKLGYPPLDTNGDGYADDIDWAKMGSAQMMVLGAMTASAMKQHGQVTDGRWFWKEYGDQHGALDYSKLPKEYGTITQAASDYPQHVEQMMQVMSYPELLNWVAQNGNDFSRAYQGFVSQMQSR